MDNPRPEKVAVVDEVRERLRQADAVIVTEYRGLKVKDSGGAQAEHRPFGSRIPGFQKHPGPDSCK